MAEVEYGGIKIGGSKLLLIIPLLGTICGGLWGGFELWTRYQQMEVKISVEDSLTAKMKTLDTDINNKVKKALNNPLSKM